MKNMYMWNTLTILLLISSSYGDSLLDLMSLSMSACAKFKYYFANLTSITTSCFIRSSQPLRICQNCLTCYKTLQKEYDLLIKGEIGADEKLDCEENLLRSDVSSAIQEIASSLESEWYDMNCDQCYIKDTNNLTKRFSTFLENEMLLMKCFQQFTNASMDFSSETFETLWPASAYFNSNACSVCSPFYDNVNKVYDDEESKNGNRSKPLWGGVCGDMGDIMNTTRYLWSKKFNCNRTSAKLGLIAPICVAVVISLLFYCLVSTYFHNKMKTVFYKQRRLRAFYDENDSHSGRAEQLQTIN